MAAVTDFRLRVEWLDAPDVRTPELAATWARYEMWIGQDCITQVDAGSSFRRSVYGSLYPLAEWVAANWWPLRESIRPSAIPVRSWTWPLVRQYDWLRHHNLRSAGDGMAWPDLTIVPEGPVTHVRWVSDHGGARPVRFTAHGDVHLPAEDVATALADLVILVLDRLAEMGVTKSRLAEDWAALGRLDADEQAFCSAAARLGLDPFAVPDELADRIVEAAAEISDDLAADFFDNADPARLALAAEWTRRAGPVAAAAASRAEKDLRHLRRSVAREIALLDAHRPWQAGYAMARRVRSDLGIAESSRFDVSPWLGVDDVAEEPGGMQGLAVVDRARCGVVLGAVPRSGSGRTFAQARTLGRTLVRPERPTFLLSASHGRDEQVARAFAAELLAPAAGILDVLATHDRTDEIALEAAAEHFGVSPMVVQHQYDNQLAGTTE